MAGAWRLPIWVTVLPCAHAGMKALRALNTYLKPIQHPIYNGATDVMKNLLDPIGSRNIFGPSVGML